MKVRWNCGSSHIDIVVGRGIQGKRSRRRLINNPLVIVRVVVDLKKEQIRDLLFGKSGTPYRGRFSRLYLHVKLKFNDFGQMLTGLTFLTLRRPMLPVLSAVILYHMCSLVNRLPRLVALSIVTLWVTILVAEPPPLFQRSRILRSTMSTAKKSPDPPPFPPDDPVVGM